MSFVCLFQKPCSISKSRWCVFDMVLLLLVPSPSRCHHTIIIHSLPPNLFQFGSHTAISTTVHSLAHNHHFSDTAFPVQGFNKYLLPQRLHTNTKTGRVKTPTTTTTTTPPRRSKPLLKYKCPDKNTSPFPSPNFQMPSSLSCFIKMLLITFVFSPRKHYPFQFTLSYIHFHNTFFFYHPQMFGLYTSC